MKNILALCCLAFIMGCVVSVIVLSQWRSSEGTPENNSFGPPEASIREEISTSTGSKPEFIIIYHSKPAYTLFVGSPDTLPTHKLKDLKSLAGANKGIEIVEWDKFIRSKNRYVVDSIERNDYPNIPNVKGIVELIRKYPGQQLGLTWNSGLAITYKDFQHAKSRYQKYQKNPSDYDRHRNRAPRGDLVHPMGHLGLLPGG